MQAREQGFVYMFGCCSGSPGRMIRRKHDYFFPLLFPCTQGSRLVQEGRALP